MQLILKRNTTLEEVLPGNIFGYGSTLALKTEYHTEKGAVEAYIIGSGEFFWGGTNTPEDQRKLEVSEYVLVSS